MNILKKIYYNIIGVENEVKKISENYNKNAVLVSKTDSKYWHIFFNRIDNFTSEINNVIMPDKYRNFLFFKIKEYRNDRKRIKKKS